MKTDIEILKDVKDELKWDAGLRNASVNVDIKDGNVVLTGFVDSYPKKIQADEAVRRIIGVRSVSNDLKVSIPPHSKRTDDEIRKAVLASIKWNSSIDETKINVAVEDGWVSLTGTVDWQYQRAKARVIAEDITGVVGVTNLIAIASTSSTLGDVRENIDSALKRNQLLNGDEINVEVDNGIATLSGQVGTLTEKNVAETAAWCAPGITSVVNELTVDYSKEFV